MGEKMITHKILMYYSKVTKERFVIEVTTSELKQYSKSIQELYKINKTLDISYYTYQNNSVDFEVLRREVTFFAKVKKLSSLDELVDMMRFEAPLTEKEFKISL